MYLRIKKRPFNQAKINRIVTICLLLIFVCILTVSCGKKNEADSDINNTVQDITPSPEPTATPKPTATPIPTPTPEPTPTPDLHIGEVKSSLTGLWVKEEVAKSRPWAFAINNIILANPQSGVGEASIIYEALTEGGITRLLAIFEGIDDTFACKDRIGSVRSARHYFASFANEYDAIYIHFGGTSYAYDKIEELKMDDLDCMKGAGVSCYFRDDNIKAPHNAFCTLDRINKCLTNGNYRLDHKENYVSNHFRFNEEAVVPESTSVKDANRISLSYRNDFVPYLTYDSETQLYTRFQFGSEHIDYNTNEPLTFTSIIIQVVNEWNKDKNGYQDMDLTDAKGHGYYISMGKCVPITWSKSESKKAMYYYDEKGNVLNINPGKTFISIYPDYREEKLNIE